MEKDGRLVNRAPAPQVPDRKTNHLQNSQIAQILDPTSEQLDSIKKYQVSFFFFNKNIIHQNSHKKNVLRVHLESIVLCAHRKSTETVIHFQQIHFHFPVFGV